MNKQPYQLECISGLLSPQFTEEIITWWEDIFHTSFAWLAVSLAGKEAQYNTSSLYLFRQSDHIIATCRIVHSCDDVRLGCLGEVATCPEFRGQGLAHKLCQLAISDFERRQGKALFLATENPGARRLYVNLGWKSVVGSNTMVRLLGAYSSERFFSDYFHDGLGLPVSVVCGGPRCRIAQCKSYATHGFIIFLNLCMIVPLRGRLLIAMLQNFCTRLYHHDPSYSCSARLDDAG